MIITGNGKADEHVDGSTLPGAAGTGWYETSYTHKIFFGPGAIGELTAQMKSLYNLDLDRYPDSGPAKWWIDAQREFWRRHWQAALWKVNTTLKQHRALAKVVILSQFGNAKASTNFWNSLYLISPETFQDELNATFIACDNPGLCFFDEQAVKQLKREIRMADYAYMRSHKDFKRVGTPQVPPKPESLRARGGTPVGILDVQ
jgi:hypothetical protein